MSDLSRLPRLGALGRTRLEAAAQRDGSSFLVEGRKHVADVLARGHVPVRELWLADDLAADVADALVAAAASRRIPVGVATSKELDKAADAVTPQGVLAVADDPAWSLADLIRGAQRPLLLLDEIQDPGNVGAILRVAAAFGASGVLIAEGTADPLGPKALRASAGTALAIPFARGSAAACRDAIEAQKLPIWLLDGAKPGEKGVYDLFELDAPAEVFVLAVGNEGRGASASILAAASRRVTIPISPAVESLNAAVAVGIAAAYLLRPRRRPVAAPRDRRPTGGGARRPYKERPSGTLRPPSGERVPGGDRARSPDRTPGGGRTPDAPRPPAADRGPGGDRSPRPDRPFRPDRGPRDPRGGRA